MRSSDPIDPGAKPRLGASFRDQRHRGHLRIAVTWNAKRCPRLQVIDRGRWSLRGPPAHAAPTVPIARFGTPRPAGPYGRVGDRRAMRDADVINRYASLTRPGRNHDGLIADLAEPGIGTLPSAPASRAGGRRRAAGSSDGSVARPRRPGQAGPPALPAVVPSASDGRGKMEMTRWEGFRRCPGAGTTRGR